MRAASLNALFEAAVQAYADRPCLEFLGRQWRYREVDTLVGRAAAGLAAMGVKPGDRVGLCLPNSMHFVVSYFATLRLGAVVVNFNPLYAPPELDFQARDAGVGVMVTTDLAPIQGRVLALLRSGAISAVVLCPFASGLSPIKAAAFRLFKRSMIEPLPSSSPAIVTWPHLLSHGAAATALQVSPQDLAVLQYTGGTTGSPKGAMLTHANLAANAWQVQSWFPDNRPGHERVLAVLPLFHVFAMTVVLNAALGWGAEIVLLPRFEMPSFLAAMRRRRPTIMAGVPTLFRAIVDKGATEADLASLAVCISGGASLPHSVKQAFEQKAACRLVEGYGLTEASPVCYCNPVRGEQRPGTIGLPLPELQAEIRALRDPSLRMPFGEPGELCLRGPNVMLGYWHRPDATSATMTEDGWLRTGDVAIMAEDGFVEIVDRIKDLIICSGFNVYPRSIEDALYRHPDVVEAVVVGVPDPYRGEAAVAFVQLAPGATSTPETLAAFLKGQISPIEQPQRIEIRDALPRTLIGKLSRKELRAELEAI